MELKDKKGEREGGEKRTNRSSPPFINVVPPRAWRQRYRRGLFLGILMSGPKPRWMDWNWADSEVL